MRKHPQGTIAKIIWLRNHGYSIHEIMSSLQLSKTTVWHHIKNVKILPRYQQRLRERRGGSKIRKEKDVRAAAQKATELLSGKHQYIISLLAMLYWAEGSKRELVFTNTDPHMIRLFLSVLKTCLRAPHNTTVITIRYFSGMNEEHCRTYWAQAIPFPRRALRMYYNDGGKRGKSPFGICRVTIKKGSFVLKIIYALIERIKENVPVAQLD